MRSAALRLPSRLWGWSLGSAVHTSWLCGWSRGSTLPKVERGRPPPRRSALPIGGAIGPSAPVPSSTRSFARALKPGRSAGDSAAARRAASRTRSSRGVSLPSWRSRSSSHSSPNARCSMRSYLMRGAIREAIRDAIRQFEPKGALHHALIPQCMRVVRAIVERSPEIRKLRKRFIRVLLIMMMMASLVVMMAPSRSLIASLIRSRGASPQDIVRIHVPMA